MVSKRGRLVDKGFLYKLLNNRVYLGEAVHKGTAYPGEHAAIVDRSLWDKVQAILAENGKVRGAKTRCQSPALLKGLIFGPNGKAMTPSQTRRCGRLYRYYVSTDVLKQGPEACTVRRVPGAEIERAVVDHIRAVLAAPEMIARVWKSARREGEEIGEAEAVDALRRLDPVWDELFPAEQARIVQLLVERIDVRVDGITVHLRAEGLGSLVGQLRQRQPETSAV